MPDTSTSRATGRRHTDITLTVSLVLAGLVAILILVGSIFYSSDQKGVYGTPAEHGVADNWRYQNSLGSDLLTTMGVGFGRRLKSLNMEKPRGDLSEASPVPSGEPVGGIHTVTDKKVIAVLSLSTTLE